ncbi:MAG: hypothetical protein ACKVPX_10545 [Myxococcaceae bacterium]
MLLGLDNSLDTLFRGLPGRSGPSYIELLEQNAHIIYPALAAFAAILLILGIVSAWRSQELAGLRKAELKREIILELRRQMVGLSGDALAKAIGIEPLTTVKLLEEMQRDGVLISHTNTERLTLWRLKGVPVRAVSSF